MRETKIICNECGTNMTNEDGAAIEQASTTVKGVSFTIERRIAAISRLDDGTNYDICATCKAAVLKEPLTEDYKPIKTGVKL